MHNQVRPKDVEYIQKGWDHNAKNCNVPLDRSVLICDQLYDYEASLIRASFILGKIGVDLDNDQATFHFCGKWRWIEFSKIEDAIAFKLVWE